MPVTSKRAIVSKRASAIWCCHTTRLLREILTNTTCAILHIPLNIFQTKLAEVAQRATELNDPVLDGLMAELALYSVADPDDPEYNAKVAERTIKRGRKLTQRLNSRRKDPRRPISL